MNDDKTIDTSFEFKPQNPFTIDIPNQKETGQVAYPGFSIEPGVFETAVEEFKETATLSHIFHAANKPLTEPADITVQALYPEVNDKFYKPAPPGWNPKVEIEKQPNIDPKYIPRLMDSKTPADFQYRLDDISQQQNHDQVLQNGSVMGKIFGGSLGYTLGSIENLIPLTSLATKAKVGAGFLSGSIRSIPGISIASAVHEGAKQMDSDAPKLQEFLKNTFIDTAFGVSFFGALGAGKSILNRIEFNNIKEFARKYLDGIGYDYVIDKKGNLKGFRAVDTTGGSLSAAEVTKAQEHADAAFYKGGLFKIPYLGEAALRVVSGNIPGLEHYLGSPLIEVFLSKYKAAHAFVNSAFDHFITTEGEAKGGTRPLSFELKVKQTRAMLTSLQAQTIALHAERNGYTITSRPAIGLANAWSAFKQKSIETMSKETKSTDWVSKEDFMDEVQRVLYSEETSEHSAVNTAAGIYRKVIDNTFKDFRVAHNLPENWLPPKTAVAYLMRVYDTNFLSSHEGQQLWMSTITKWLQDSDKLITNKMEPIHILENQIAESKTAHAELIKQPNITDSEIKQSSDRLDKLRRDLKISNDHIQNELRTNPDLNIHVDDVNALSANEAEELEKLQKPLNDINQQIKEQQKIVSSLKNQKSKAKSASMKGKTIKTAQKHAETEKVTIHQINLEENKLKELQTKAFEENEKLQEMAETGKMNPRFFTKEPEANRYKFRDTNERLKFRNVHESDYDRQQAARGYLDSILHMQPEDIVADVFGKLTGKTSENALKQRTLMIPDEILYNNNFLTKDLHAKTANYVNYLSRRTHLKTSFKNVTVNGDFNELAVDLLNEFKMNQSLISNRIDKLNNLIKNNSELDISKFENEIKKEKKNFQKEKYQFEKIKEVMKMLYENRMMGLNKRSDRETMVMRTWKNLVSATNLHNLPATQITDLAFAGFQHGIWPSIRDGIYPIINSMAGILKTADAEALREMAPHINLGYQDVGNTYAEQNWNSQFQPFINMGRIQRGIEKYAHFSALTDGSIYIDNGVQRAHGSIIQSRFMELLHKEVAGNLTDKESLYLRKYGIDPKVWAERMVNAYKASNGFKNKLGGYISKAWEWQDLEAANLFNDGVFRGIQNTLVFRGMADSPFFADNILGFFMHTFTGWGYAATNRYLIPSLQHPDGALLLKMMWMMGAGALVSPTRRVARGEDPWPEDMTLAQIAYEAFSDSGVFSVIANVLNLVNLMLSDKLLGDLKNDKFRNRMRTGIFGMTDVVSSTFARMTDVLGMVNSGLDEKDLKTAARMLPITGAMYGHYASNKLIESWNLPWNKRAAENQ